LRISAEFVKSAAGAADFPNDHLAEVALAGRSNVGKSSLINALLGKRVARTSAAPGKTRLANFYRVVRGTDRPFYLVDLPGYGYARGGRETAGAFDALTRDYFAGTVRLRGHGGEGLDRPAVSEPSGGTKPGRRGPAGLLLVDARHPGLPSDVGAWAWLKAAVADPAIVLTKVDKLTRGSRIRAMREFESVFEDSVLPVSAATGEGLDELWKLIDRLANSRNPHLGPSSSPPRATGPHLKKK
jgi:GTP-binding protein